MAKSDDLTKRALTRRQLLKGAGGVAAAGATSSVLGVPRAWATPNSHSRTAATTVSSWVFRPEYKDAIEGMIAAFEKSHPDINVTMKYTPSQNYGAALKTALVGGGATDTFATSAATGITGDTGADGGYIAPLDGLVKLNTLLPTAARVIQYKGHVYAAPCQQFRIGIYINRPLFSKANVRIPRTWADLTAAYAKFQAAGIIPMIMGGQDMILPWFYYACAVNSVLGPKGFPQLLAGKRKLTDPDLLRAAQFTIDSAKYFEPGFQAVSYTEAKALFAQSRGAMVIGGSSDFAGYSQINPNIQVGFIGFPPPRKTPHVQGYSMAGLSMAMLANKNASNLQAAKTFAAWWASPEAQQAILDYIGLPSLKGLKPTGNTDRARVLKAILKVPDLPSWLDYGATGNNLTAALGIGNGLFTGKMSAREFAQALQNDFKV